MSLFNIFHLVIFLLQWFSWLDAKVLIITHAYKREDFIELQHRTFKKLLKEEYEFVVYNDAKESVISERIESVCRRLHIKCIQVPQEIHRRPYLPREAGEAYDSACVACANVVQYSLDTIGFSHDDIVMIIDSDMFLVQPFSIYDYMKGYDLSGLAQSRNHITYLWNGIVFLNMKTLPDKKELSFNCGRIEGQPCDVGGYTYYYLKKHPEVRIKFVPDQHYVAYSMNNDKAQLHPYMRLMVEEDIPNSEFFINFSFFHYRGGGNWDNKSDSYHKQKTNALHKLINIAINNVE